MLVPESMVISSSHDVSPCLHSSACVVWVGEVSGGLMNYVLMPGAAWWFHSLTQCGLSVAVWCQPQRLRVGYLLLFPARIGVYILHLHLVVCVACSRYLYAVGGRVWYCLHHVISGMCTVTRYMAVKPVGEA